MYIDQNLTKKLISCPNTDRYIDVKCATLVQILLGIPSKRRKKCKTCLTIDMYIDQNLTKKQISCPNTDRYIDVKVQNLSKYC